MKLITIIAFYTSLNVCAQNIWTQLDSVKGPPKTACIAESIAGYGYLGTGADQLGFKKSLFKYNTGTDNWTQEASLGGPSGDGYNRASAISFVCNNKLYVGLGQGSIPFMNDLWEYNPISDTWTQKANFIGSARRQAVGFAIQNLGYAGTGEDLNGPTDDFYQYSPAFNNWQQVSSFPGGIRKGAVGFTMGDQAYVGTGDDNNGYKNDFYQYEPTTDSWIQKSNFPSTPRTGAVGWGVFPNAYIATGYDNTLNFKKDVWAYNYFFDAWQQQTDLIGPARSNAVAFTIGNTAYLGTGFNNDWLDDFYKYDATLDLMDMDESNFVIYPNPAQNQFQVDCEFRLSKIDIYTLDGKLVKHMSNPESSSVVDVSHLNSGIHIVVLKTMEGKSYSKKITLTN